MPAGSSSRRGPGDVPPRVHTWRPVGTGAGVGRPAVAAVLVFGGATMALTRGATAAAVVLAVTGVLACLTARSAWRRRVEVDAEGIVVVRLRGQDVVPWSDLADVTTGRGAAARRWYLVRWDGTSVALPAGLDGADVRRWWSRFG